MKIIIVEHHSHFSQAFYKVLKKCEHVDVVGVFDNCIECFSILNKEHIDVVILDYDLPENESFIAAKKIVENQRYIKIIGLSCNDDFDFLRSVLESGASRLFSKYEIFNNEFHEALKQNYYGRAFTFSGR